MFELVYTYIVATTLKEEDILDIQKISREANKKIDITGCLFYRGNQFVGILEGSKKNVKKLFSKIGRNHNHTDISIVAKGPIMERQFDQWNMISAMGPKNGTVGSDDGLQVMNILGLAQLSEKHTYGSRVFWHTVKSIIRETELKQAN